MAKTTDCPKHGRQKLSSGGQCVKCKTDRQRERRKEQRAAKRKAETSWSPHADSENIPPGFVSKGTSTLRKVIDPATGELVPQWQKTEPEKLDKFEQIRDAFESLTDAMPTASLIHSPAHDTPDDLLTIYPMGDPHLGMLSWAPETGEDFDLKIATAQLLAAADWLVDKAPASKTAVVINLGDFFHSDNSSNQTWRSGHALDVDSRWPKILRAGVHCMCRLIERALAKHEHVIVRCEIGNHDDHSAIMLAIALEMRYQENPRVTIDTSPAKYWYYRFGCNLFGTTHGNGVKLAELGEIMAFDRADDWGETEFRHWYVGHVHHESVKERRGVVIETFRTLAGRDAWHHAAGYRSGRDMRCDVWHREFGLETRHVVPVKRLIPNGRRSLPPGM